ncbi:alpha-ketoglutarate-dependent dioxygenase alkB homolog 6-like [Eurytemora carolleeae]|uniref:alpha-ketoglutarate-dependent dioxygenase alkB homolog 6-like n=1 Tax=Eurytemora carolleeae TaxID=1294199 RepID=UPI000C77EF07|nr:alpha-ketoglutarate-dependent dioxygenase alkB homolog 6-like [Eurytemora carolleeae]|eukprot:XP_023334117.1 alpha-ketoglutarate-dependent dioxygenase alkB homolog 6-like [Eurytemora affinis]
MDDVTELEKFRVPSTPPRVYYLPNFITHNEEIYLLGEIKKTPGPRWTQLLNRRLQNWGGIPHHRGMIAENIPPWLQCYVDRVNNLNIFGGKKANHVLLNEYTSGQGIMPHLDGSLFSPTISTISLGSHTVINFYDQDNGENGLMNPLEKRLILSLYLEPRSLLVLQEDMYNNYMHGIEEKTKDEYKEYANFPSQLFEGVLERETRYSLTIRHVPKTTKLKIKFGK